MLLRIDPVGAFSSLGLEGLDSVAGLLHRPGHKTAHRVLLPRHLLHDLRQRGSVLALQHRDHLSGLTALAWCAGFSFGWFRCLSAFGRLLSRGGLLPRLTFCGRALGVLCAALGLFVGFRLLAASVW